MAEPSAIDMDLTDHVDPADEALILAGLSTFNDTELLGPTDRRPLAVFLRNDAGAVIGGLVAHTARGWLYVRMLFVPDALRGQGYGSRLLQMAEAEARARGCKGAWLDTVNPDALRLYQRLGYTRCGAIEDFTHDLPLTWLMKRF